MPTSVAHATFVLSMRVHTDLASIRTVHRPVLTTGTFDGVHRGHRTILDRLTGTARKEEGESVLFTFHPHPRMVLFSGDSDLKLLCTQQEKVRLLEEAGLDHLLVIPFSRDFSRMRATDYVREVLVGAIGVRAVVIGYDHRFGRDREGDLRLLQELGHAYDFNVEEIPAQEVDHIRVSSTKIRHALVDGDLRTANELLGYRYSLSGVVVKGEGLGRELGFPTANLALIDPHKLVPADGIYAVLVEGAGIACKGMMYIGRRPSIATADGSRSIEVNLFGVDRALYGESLTVRCIDRIRGDMHFEDMNGLIAQMERDRMTTEQRLANL